MLTLKEVLVDVCETKQAYDKQGNMVMLKTPLGKMDQMIDGLAELGIIPVNRRSAIQPLRRGEVEPKTLEMAFFNPADSRSILEALGHNASADLSFFGGKHI